MRRVTLGVTITTLPLLPRCRTKLGSKYRRMMEKFMKIDRKTKPWTMKIARQTLFRCLSAESFLVLPLLQ